MSGAPRRGEGFETPQEVLARWEKEDNCLSTCSECKAFYEAAKEGKMPYDVFMPRHGASKECKSGKRPHCTCDSCF